jgi:GTP-binding protein
VVRRELELHEPGLLARRALLVGTKLDAISDRERLVELAAVGRAMGVPTAAISAVSGEGLDAMLELMFALAAQA